MKYHSSLIKKYISVNDSPEHIAQNLTLKSCEIEEINERNIPDSIVIGYVKSCEKHPDADRLNVCQVDCGDKGEYQIICGGSNVRAGIYVPVALPGTIFVKAGITIEKRKMRGVESNGMICSKEELEINEDQNLHSIWDLILDLGDLSEVDLGTPLAQKFPRLNSFVLEVDNKGLTNRPDLTGHFGAAVELHAMYRDPSQVNFNKVHSWMKQFVDVDIFDQVANATPAQRKVLGEAGGVNSYTLLEINSIDIKPLSFFTRLHMIDLGANPKNNRVDFSNLFMLLTGQPIHFFDADKVDGDIIVRNAQEGEEFVDLFETKHILQAGDIVIADKNKILALAGVVGGLHSGISDSTKNILVEIANFDPVAVRKTGTRLGLRTDAELRFEKNINPWWSLYCLLLFLEELKYYKKDLGNFEIGGVCSYTKASLLGSKDKKIAIDLSIIEKNIFGNSRDHFESDAKDILFGLGFEIKDNSVVCPIRRSPDDLNIQEDITEEIIRIYGYEHVSGLPVLSDVQYTPYIPSVQLMRDLEDIFIQDFSFDQTETYPWISDKLLKQFGSSGESCYSLQNPINTDTPYLRDSLVYNLLGYASKNSKFFDQFRIFDIGNIWKKPQKETPQNSDIYATSFVDESLELGGLIYEKDMSSREKDSFLTMKSLLHPLMSRLGICGNFSFKPLHHGFFHPKKQAEIFVNGVGIGYFASFHPLILKDHKLPETAGLTYLSLSLQKLIALKTKEQGHSSSYETLQDQIVWRDLCFVVNMQDSFAPILAAVKAIPEIRELEVFDAYEGKNLGEGKKSVSFKIKITGDGSLTTDQINEVMNKAITAAEKAGGSLRA